MISLILLAALLGFFVWYGTVTYDPTMNAFPDNEDVGPNPETYVDQKVSLGGTVVATDPVVIGVEYDLDESRRITLAHIDEDITEANTSPSSAH